MLRRLIEKLHYFVNGKQNVSRVKDNIFCQDIVKEKLKYDLNGKDVYLVDYENTAALPKEAYLFSGRKKRFFYVFLNKDLLGHFRELEKERSAFAQVEIVLLDKTGMKNYLDIGLGMYLGMIQSAYKVNSISIYSKDNGYQVLKELAYKLTDTEICLIKPSDNLKIGKYKSRLSYLAEPGKSKSAPHKNVCPSGMKKIKNDRKRSISDITYIYKLVDSIRANVKSQPMTLETFRRHIKRKNKSLKQNEIDCIYQNALNYELISETYDDEDEALMVSFI